MVKIYCLEECAVIASMGENTFVEEEFVCDFCKILRPEFTKYIHIHLVFDTWLGEDIIADRGNVFISQRLKNSLEEKSIKGVTYDETSISCSKYFKADNKAYQKELPKFYYLNPINHSAEIESPIFEFTGEVCPNCKGRKYDMKPDGLDFLVGIKSESGEIKIDKGTWGNEDFFYANKSSKPFITEKFRNAIRNFNTQQTTIKEVNWKN